VYGFRLAKSLTVDPLCQHGRVFEQCQCSGFGDQRVPGQFRHAESSKLRLQLFAEARGFREISIEEERDAGRRLGGGRHALGGDSSDPGQRMDVAGQRPLRRRHANLDAAVGAPLIPTRRRSCQHVLLSDAAAWTRALDVANADAVFLSQAPRKRSGDDACLGCTRGEHISLDDSTLRATAVQSTKFDAEGARPHSRPGTGKQPASVGGTFTRRRYGYRRDHCTAWRPRRQVA